MKTKSLFTVAAFVAATTGWGVSSPAVAQEVPGTYGVDRQALIDAAETLGVEFDPETLTVPVEGFEEGVSEGADASCFYRQGSVQLYLQSVTG